MVRRLKALLRSLTAYILVVTMIAPCVAGCRPSSDPSDTATNEISTPWQTEEATTEEATTEEATTDPPIDPPEHPQGTLFPSLHITTADGLPIVSQTEGKDVVITISGSLPAYNITAEAEMKGRGNSSFDGEAPLDDYKSKNSYNIKFNKKINLLGVGETADKDWVLIASKYDASALRNYLVWNLAEKMGRLPFVPESTWVELYINQDCRGMYILCEKIEVASDRVNIDDSPSTDPTDVGYLVEYDLRGASKAGAVLDLTYFRLQNTDQAFEWVLQSEVYTPAETAAVRTHLQTCHDAILSGDRQRIEPLIDMPSFVDMFILQELSKNPDVGCSSFYMQRDRGGKLYLTAPWDFDFAFGSYNVSVDHRDLVVDSDTTHSHPWFEALAEQEWFMRMVDQRLEEVSPLWEETKGEILALMPALTVLADRNHERWNIYGQKFAIYPNDQVSVHLHSYEEHVTFLTQWTDKRFGSLKHAIDRHL